MKKKIFSKLVVGLLTFGLAESVYASSVQWQLQDGGNGHWYDIVSTNGINFYGAETAASTAGGYLATPDLAGEGDFIFSNLTNPASSGRLAGYWLGAYSNGSADSWQWQWVTGGTVTAFGGPLYIDWAEGNTVQGLIQIPNNWWTSGNALQDAPAGAYSVGYVIEFNTLPNSSPVPAPSTMLLLSTGLIGLTALARRKSA